MSDTALAQTVVAAYLDRYHERRSTSEWGLPFESWEPNFVLAETYARISGDAKTPRARAVCVREMDDLTTAASRGQAGDDLVNALAYLWTRRGPLSSSHEVPPPAVTRALADGGTDDALTGARGTFWRVRVLPALRRFANPERAALLDLELRWWSKRLLIWPRLMSSEHSPEFATVASAALLQAELATESGSTELADAARTGVRVLADPDRYPLSDVPTVEIARALLAARLADEPEVQKLFLDELLGPRLDTKRGLLYSRSAGARYEFAPWVPRGLAAAVPSFDQLLDAMARPLSGLQAGVAR